jgi:hypothetical protein
MSENRTRNDGGKPFILPAQTSGAGDGPATRDSMSPSIDPFGSLPPTFLETLEAGFGHEPGLPGSPLDSGFVYRPVGSFAQLQLPEAERHRLLDKEQSVMEALRRAQDVGADIYLR